MTRLELHRLTLRFGGLTAVNALSLGVGPGQIFSLIGPNGAGKTTVFNAITGLVEPSEGRVAYEGAELRRPFMGRTGLGVALIGLLTGLGLTLAAHLESLWEITITAQYQYLQPFPWSQALGSAWGYFLEAPLQRLGIPMGVGTLLGASGALSVWWQSRREPEVAAKAGLARTFQNIRLFHQMTALDNVLLGMDTRLRTTFWQAALRLPHYWKEGRESRAEAMEILRFVGLEAEVHRLATNLPYGHKRRLEIARALALKPSLVLLDEPAAGMNPAETQALMDLIHRIRDQGATILLIEHDMKVVMGISDRIAVMDHGEKIAEGTPEEVRRDPKVIEAYLGSHAGS